MKASVVANAVASIDKIEVFIMTSTAVHSTRRISEAEVDTINEIMKYVDVDTKQRYILDCNDINMIVYKPGESI